jgi:hypothetical protein
MVTKVSMVAKVIIVTMETKVIGNYVNQGKHDHGIYGSLAKATIIAFVTMVTKLTHADWQTWPALHEFFSCTSCKDRTTVGITIRIGTKIGLTITIIFHCCATRIPGDAGCLFRRRNTTDKHLRAHKLFFVYAKALTTPTN